MTIEEIDKAGYKVKLMTRSQIPGAGYYDAVRLEKNGKLYIAWKPQGHTEYTTPFFLSALKPITATIKVMSPRIMPDGWNNGHEVNN